MRYICIHIYIYTYVYVYIYVYIYLISHIYVYMRIPLKYRPLYFSHADKPSLPSRNSFKSVSNTHFALSEEKTAAPNAAPI
jgi:hypothetical protein